jgi:dTDP-4-amino-4,6-dideoxygalactose transaminase
MEHKRIYLCLAHMSETGAEQRYIKEAFETNWVVPLGPNVNGFEADLEAFVGQRRKVVALSSCTGAIHLALLLLGVRQGDEVLCQSLSFCASTNPVTYCGATPVFIDSEKDTWNMNPILVEQAINDRIAKTGKKPKAIIAVDLYGMPAQWDELEEIGRKYDIPIIEDAANALGSFYAGKPCGVFGQLATFSFNGNKIITTSGGGALLCDDEETKKHIIFLATQARENAPYYQHEVIGFNYRLSNISAGIGRGQMTILNDHIRHHKHVYELYKSLLKDVKGFAVHDNPSQRFDSNFWLTTITIDPSVRVKGQDDKRSIYSDCEPNTNVEALRVFLDQKGIEARPLWKPMHKQPVYKDTPAYLNGVSEGLFKVGMCLPSGPYVSDEDVHYIVESIKEAIEL